MKSTRPSIKSGIRRFLFSVFLPLCVCFSSLHASEPLKVTVREAIIKGLENNRALKVQRLTPQILKALEADERAAFDPVLKGEVIDQKDKSQQLLKYGSTVTNLTSREITGNVSLEEFLPTGTKLNIEASTDILDSSLYQGDFDSTRAGISLTQSLLKGAGLGVNLASLRQAKLDTLASEYELKGFSEELVGRIESTYWDYVLAQRQIEIYTNSLNIAEQQLAETRERINLGKTASVEISAAEAEVALRKEGLINTRNRLETTRLQFLRLLNVPVSNLFDTVVILLDDVTVPDAKLDDVSSHIQVAMRMRPDLNQARLNLQRNDLEIIKTRNGLLPRLDLFITMGNTGYADSFSDSARNIKGDYYDYSAGIQLEYPLGNRSASAKTRRARLSLEQSEEAVSNMTQIVEVDVRSAYMEVNRAREEITAIAATVKHREETARAEAEKFRVGKSTSLLVAQTQRDLLASRIQKVQSVITCIKALINLYRLEGSLLDRRGIAVPAETGRK